MNLSRRAALIGSSLSVTAMSPAQREAVIGGSVGPILSLNFIPGLLDQRITFARASIGWEFDSTGALTSFSSNTPRFGYSPSTLAARGLLIEEARTNSLLNNSMTGAVVGTPGTLPTNWSSSQNTGLSLNVVGFGTDHGIPYVDIRINGTTAVGASNNIQFAPGTQIAAVQNQVWNGSVYYQLAAGSLTNVSTILHIVQPLTAAGAGLTASSASLTPTGSALASQRTSTAYTLAGATTAWVRSLIQVNFSAAPVAVDLTLRIGAPQLELGSSATSPILTTNAAVTRAADVATMPLITTPAYSIVAEAEVDAPVACTGNQTVVQADDGTNNNRMVLYRVLGTGASTSGFVAGGVGVFSPTQAVIAQGATYKVGGARASSNNSMATNGVLSSGSVAGDMAQSTTLRIGSGVTSVGQLNGHFRLVRYWPRLLSGGELMSATT